MLVKKKDVFKGIDYNYKTIIIYKRLFMNIISENL